MHVLPKSEGLDRGYLRPAVRIAFDEKQVRINYALWEISIPSSWVAESPVFRNILERRQSLANIGPTDGATAGLITLLSKQGCFTPYRSSHYALREVRSRFDPLRSEWYAAYYAHPTWDRLWCGAADRKELIAWVIHNYHVSRAAGCVAARMVALGRTDEWDRFFKQDALSEYWHCNAYYFVESKSLPITIDQAKAYVPLPASLAFEHQTLRLAEDDPLAHLLVAYFQEASIVFKPDSERFYRSVEETYGLPRFFRSWEQHINIDIDEAHAEGLSELLDSDRQVTAESLSNSVRNAWIAFFFLYNALDDIRGEEHSISHLRLPVQDGRIEGCGSLLRMWTKAPAEGVVFRDLASLYEWYVHAAPLPPPGNGPLPETEARAIRHALCRSAFRALSFCRDHDEIMLCGQFAEILANDDTKISPERPWTIAINNYLYETTTRPLAWVAAAALVVLRSVACFPSQSLFEEQLAGIRPRLARWGSIAISTTESDRYLTQMLQLDELLQRWTHDERPIPDDSLLT
jgi:hypothetical protein